MATVTASTSARLPRAQRARKWRDLTPLTGALFVLVMLGAFIVAGNTPEGDASAQAVIDHYTANRTQGIVASIVLALAAVPALAFSAWLRERARLAVDNGRTLASFALGTGVLTAAGLLGAATIHLALSEYTRDLDLSAAQALNALGADSFILFTTGIATLVLAGSLIALRSRMLPSWLGWLGIPVAIAMFTPVAFFAACVAGAWIILASLLLYASNGGSRHVMDPDCFEPDAEPDGGASVARFTRTPTPTES